MWSCLIILGWTGEIWGHFRLGRYQHTNILYIKESHIPFNCYLHGGCGSWTLITVHHSLIPYRWVRFPEPHLACRLQLRRIWLSFFIHFISMLIPALPKITYNLTCSAQTDKATSHPPGQIDTTIMHPSSSLTHCIVLES